MVFADSSDLEFASTSSNQFLIRAGGGVGINTNDPNGRALFVAGDLEVTGQIIGNVTITNANLSTVSASNAFTLQTGETTGFFVGVVTKDGDSGSGRRNIVGGHQSNTVTAGRVGATIGGGGGEIDGTVYSNAVTWNFGTVAGGLANTADGYATVGGGDENKASGLWSTVPGGQLNQASGNYSFAAGRQAKAINNGAFVWADSQDDFFNSTGDNQFLIRANGGVGINNNNPGTNALLVGGATRITGTLVVDGGIVSGSNNTTTGTGSVTGGGVNNTNSGTQSTIAGGSGNAIYFSAAGGAIGGGTANLVTNNATNGTIGGGAGNTIGGNYTTIGGGFDNGATGEASTVGGGDNNLASGNYSTVPGGLGNGPAASAPSPPASTPRRPTTTRSSGAAPPTP